MRTSLFFVVLAWGSCGTAVDAAVRGGRFEGVLTYSDGSDSGYLSTDFRQDGTFLESFDYGSGVETYGGTYTESSLFIISFWSLTYQDYPNYNTTGISLLGIVSTYRVNQTDGDDDFSGIVFRTGPAVTARTRK